MAEEQYIESVIMRQGNNPVVLEPSFTDEQCDVEFEFEGTVKLIQIVKSVQNESHNKHDYVFKITEIKKMKEID